MADGENIGGVNITVGADFSDLDTAFDAAVQKAQQRADAMAQAIQDGVKAPDVSPVTNALDDIGTEAQKVGQQITDSLAVTAPTIDTSQMQSSLAALADTVSTAATQITTDLGGIQAPAIDTSAAAASLSSFADIVQADSQAIETAISNALNNIDTQGYVAAFHGFIDELGLTGDAADQLQQRISDIWASGNAVDMSEAFAKALQEIGGAATSANASIEPLDSSLQEMAKDLQDAGNAAGNTVPALQKFSDGAQAIVDKQQAADAALSQAQSIFAELSAAYERGAVSADTLARAAGNLSSAFNQAHPSIQQTGSAADLATGAFSSLNTILATVGVTLSLAGFVNFAKDVADSADSITKANIALTALTGDAGQAAQVMAGLENIGISDGLSMPSLRQAATTMEALLPDTADVVSVMAQVADAAAVSGRSIESASSALDRLVTSGNASARTLMPLALNLKDIGGAMDELGISAGDSEKAISAAFKALSENDRLAVAQTALEKFNGIAKDVAENTFSGAWASAMAQWDKDIKIVMDDLGKLGTQTLGSTMRSAVTTFAELLVVAATTIKASFDSIKGDITQVGIEMSGLGQAAGMAMQGNFTGAAVAIQTALAGVAASAQQTQAKITADWAAGARIIYDLEAQKTAAVTVTKNALDGQGQAAKSAAATFAAAISAVGQFENQITSATSSNALQAQFENASKAISQVSKVDLPAAITAVNDYLAAQERLGAGGTVILDAFDKESKLINQLAKIDLPSASDAMLKLITTLGSGATPLGVWQKALEDEEKILQQLAKVDLAAAEAGWDQLIQKLKDSNAPLSVINQALQDHSKFLDAAAKSADALVTQQIKLAEQFSNVNTKGHDATQVFKDAADTLDRLGISAANIPQPMSDANKAMSDFGVNAGKAKTAVQDLSTPIEQLVTDMGNLVKVAQNSGDWSPVLASLDNFDKRIQNIAKVDLPEAVKEIEAMIDELKNANAPTEVIAAQLDKFGGTIEKMAQQQLPGWQAAWQNYLNDLAQFAPASAKIVENLQLQIDKQNAITQGLIAQKAAYADILLSEQAAAEAAVKRSQLEGIANDNAVGGLEKIQLQLKENKLATVDLMTVYVNGINDVVKGFEQIGGAMAGAIVDGKNMGDALIGVFKNIAKSVISDLIQGALAPLEKDLVHLISGTLPSFITAQATATAGTTALGAASTTTAAAQTAMAASATGATAAVTALGIASTLAAIQVNTLITAIATVIGAIAGIIGDVYLAAIDTKLFHIETSLLEIRNETENRRKDAWDQFNSMFQRIGEIENVTQSIDASLKQMVQNGAGGGFPDQAMSDLDSIKAMADVVRIGWPTMQGALQTIASDVVTWGGYLMKDLDSINNWAGQIYTYMRSSLSANAATAQDVSQAASQVVDAVGSAADQTGNDISSAADQASSDIAQSSDVISTAVGDSADTISSAVSDAATQTASAIADSGSEMAGQIIPHLQATTDAVQQAAQTEPSWIQQQIDLSQKQYEAANTVADEIAALQNEYKGYEALMQQAIESGDAHMANVYQQQMQQVMGTLGPLLSTSQQTTTAVQAIAPVVTSGASTIAFAASGAGTLVSTSVNNAAGAIVGAVNTAAATIAAAASFRPTGGGTTTTVTTGGVGNGGGSVGTPTSGPGSPGYGNTPPNSPTTGTGGFGGPITLPPPGGTQPPPSNTPISSNPIQSGGTILQGPSGSSGGMGGATGTPVYAPSQTMTLFPPPATTPTPTGGPSAPSSGPPTVTPTIPQPPGLPPLKPQPVGTQGTPLPTGPTEHPIPPTVTITDITSTHPIPGTSEYPQPPSLPPLKPIGPAQGPTLPTAIFQPGNPATGWIPPTAASTPFPTIFTPGNPSTGWIPPNPSAPASGGTASSGAGVSPTDYMTPNTLDPRTVGFYASSLAELSNIDFSTKTMREQFANIEASLVGFASGGGSAKPPLVPNGLMDIGTPSTPSLLSTPSSATSTAATTKNITVNASVTIDGTKGGRLAAQEFVDWLKQIVPEANGFSNY